MEIVTGDTDKLAAAAIGLYYQLIPTLLLGLSPISLYCTREESDAIRRLGEKAGYVSEWLPGTHMCNCRAHWHPPELCPFDQGTIRLDKLA